MIGWVVGPCGTVFQPDYDGAVVAVTVHVPADRSLMSSTDIRENQRILSDLRLSAADTVCDALNRADGTGRCSENIYDHHDDRLGRPEDQP